MLYSLRLLVHVYGLNTRLVLSLNYISPGDFGRGPSLLFDALYTILEIFVVAWWADLL